MPSRSVHRIRDCVLIWNSLARLNNGSCLQFIRSKANKAIQKASEAWTLSRNVQTISPWKVYSQLLFPDLPHAAFFFLLLVCRSSSIPRASVNNMQGGRCTVTQHVRRTKPWQKKSRTSPRPDCTEPRAQRGTFTPPASDGSITRRFLASHTLAWIICTAMRFSAVIVFPNEEASCHGLPRGNQTPAQRLLL